MRFVERQCLRSSVRSPERQCLRSSLIRSRVTVTCSASGARRACCRDYRASSASSACAASALSGDFTNHPDPVSCFQWNWMQISRPDARSTRGAVPRSRDPVEMIAGAAMPADCFARSPVHSGGRTRREIAVSSGQTRDGRDRAEIALSRRLGSARQRGNEQRRFSSDIPTVSIKHCRGQSARRRTARRQTAATVQGRSSPLTRQCHGPAIPGCEGARSRRSRPRSEPVALVTADATEVAIESRSPGRE